MKILTLDIETAPNEGWFWKLFKTNINIDHIKRPVYMLSWSAKWLGSKTVYYNRCDSGPEFVADLWCLLAEADAVVTYNGDSFDLRHLNREFAKAGLPPPRPVASIDLYKIVKSTFALPSNKLDYAAQYFLGEKKLDTGGFDLWLGVMNGEETAWRKMLRYNKRDVVLTEKLYTFLRPWIRNHPYVGEPPELPDLASQYECPSCTGHKIELHRPRRTRCYAIRVCRCKDCGNWFDGIRRKI